MKKTISIFCFITLFYFNSFGQDPVQIMTNYSVDNKVFALSDFTNFTIFNLTNKTLYGDILIQVKESKGKSDVVRLKSTHSTLLPGLTSVPFSDFQIDFYSSEASMLLRSSGMITNGNYDICISVRLDRAEQMYQTCEQINLLGFVEIHLVAPFDKERIESLNPYLQWFSSFDQSVDYRINLTELAPYKHAEEAINKNVKLLDFPVADRSLLYPFSAPTLKYGHTYSWKVIALSKGVMVGQSETWVFTPFETEIKSDVITDCYRKINKDFNSGNYIFNGVIKFSYQNYSSEPLLNYHIMDLTSGKLIAEAPQVKLSYGMNKVDINAKDIIGIRKGHSYMIVVRNKYSEVYKLGFDYKRNF